MSATNSYGRYIKLLIYLIVIVLVNVAGITLFFRVDLTKNKIYSLSDTSKKVVSTLSEPLTIKVFFSKNLPAPHNNTERYLHDLLEEYAIHANRYFNYRFFDVSAEGETKNQRLADNYGIHPIQLQMIEQDEIKFKRAYMGLVLIHGDMIEKIPAITAIDGLEYKLTTAIQKLNNKISAFLSLPDKIQIKLFLSSSLKRVAPYMGLDKLPGYPDKLENIIKDLNDKNYGKLEYAYIDPSRDQTTDEEWSRYNIMRLKWPDLSNGEVKAGSGVIGLVIEYGKKVLEMPILKVFKIPGIGTQYNLAPIDQMEEFISHNLEAVVDINQDLGYLVGHGTFGISNFNPMEPPGEDTLLSFPNFVSLNYTIKNIDLKYEEIPEGLKCIVMARPMEKFSDYELYRIDQALMRGTSLALFMDPYKEIIMQNQQGFGANREPIYVPIDTGIQKLLDHYGIRFKKSYVLDENCYKQQYQQQFGGGERPVYFVPIIENANINHELRFMKNIKGLVAVKISPLELDEKRISENGLKATKLFSSSEKSWEMKERINFNPMFMRPPPSGEMKSIPLAYLLEGAFPSYFAGKPMPEKPSKDASLKKEQKKSTGEDLEEKPSSDLSKIEEKGVFLDKGKPGKIFLMASSEMVKDNVLGREGKNSNAVFIMNILDYLNNNEGIAVMRSKEQHFNPLYKTSALTKAVTKTFNIAGLPVLVVIFGFFVWLRRNSRKKQIRKMFQK